MLSAAVVASNVLSVMRRTPRAAEATIKNARTICADPGRSSFMPSFEANRAPQGAASDTLQLQRAE